MKQPSKISLAIIGEYLAFADCLIPSKNPATRAVGVMLCIRARAIQLNGQHAPAATAYDLKKLRETIPKVPGVKDLLPMSVDLMRKPKKGARTHAPKKTRKI